MGWNETNSGESFCYKFNNLDDFLKYFWRYFPTNYPNDLHIIKVNNAGYH